MSWHVNRFSSSHFEKVEKDASQVDTQFVNLYLQVIPFEWKRFSVFGLFDHIFAFVVRLAMLFPQYKWVFVCTQYLALYTTILLLMTTKDGIIRKKIL